jgi:proteasome lid subunit RPN8/RPN11
VSREQTDTAQIDTKTLPEKAFPGERQFRVCIGGAAHEIIWDHARQSVAAGGPEIVEVGGILLGNLYRDKEGPFLEITAAIVAEHTRNQGTQMTFTPETWAQVNRVKDTRFADTKIVGWYHTHPRFGIFLSDMDKFIHKNHFAQPWTTAFVVDPVQGSEGFFVWSDGEPRPVSEFWVARQRRDQAAPRLALPTPEQERADGAGRKDEPASAVSRASFALTSVLAFLGLLLLFGYVYMREVNRGESEKYVLAALDRQRTELQAGAGALQALSRRIEETHGRASAADADIRAQLALLAVRLQNVGVLAEAAGLRLTEQQRLIDRLYEQGPLAAPAPTSPAVPGPAPGPRPPQGARP